MGTPDTGKGASVAASKSFLAERADRIARGLEHDAMGMLRLILARPDEYVETVIKADLDAYMTNENFDKLIREVTTPDEHRLLTTLGDWSKATPGEDGIQLRRWAQTRVCYVVDADTANAVANTDWGDTVIPGEVLRRLPHINPLVVLPEPVRLPGDEGRIEKYEAFLVLGIKPPRRRADTHDPDCIGYVLHFLGRVVDPITDRPIETTLTNPSTGLTMTLQNVVGMRVLTPLEDMTMKARQEFAAEDVARLGPSVQVGFKDEDDAMARTRELTALGLSILVYLVTDDLDSRRVTVKPDVGRRSRQRRTGGTDDKPTTVIEVGYHVGAALRAAKKQHDGHNSGGGKRTVAPHVRRAHVHTFRYGPKKAFRKLQWLPPLAINAGKQAAEKTQVHFPN